MNNLVVKGFTLAFVFAAIAVVGCGGASTLDTHPVEGVVTLDGEPVPNATVMFVPVDEQQGLSATGITDQSGVYTLTAVGTGEDVARAGGGTLPGEYQIGVIKTEVESYLSEEEAMEQGIPYEPPPLEPKVDHIVPLRYNLPQRSGLTATVTEGKNNIPIELTSD